MKFVRLIKMCLKTHSKVRTGKYLSDSFPIQKGLKQYDLSPLLFNFTVEYAFRKAQESQVGQKLLAYADVILLGDNTENIRKHRNFN
jgi:hypothetical protein